MTEENLWQDRTIPMFHLAGALGSPAVDTSDNMGGPWGHREGGGQGAVGGQGEHNTRVSLSAASVRSETSAPIPAWVHFTLTEPEKRSSLSNRSLTSDNLHGSRRIL